MSDYLGATPLPLGREVMDFSSFTESHRRHIGQLVRQDTPPPKWLNGELASIVSRAWYEWHWHRGVDPDARRPKLPPSLRRFVIERDGLVCGLCDGEVERDDVHIDHVVPRSRGGSDKASNLQVSHSACNLRKGANA